MKKRYMKPSVIDLSIEGMTGIGGGIMAVNCDTGSGFTPGSCGSGTTANSSCNNGTVPTNACNDGNLPSDSGTYCEDGTGASGRACQDGSDVSGYNPYCNTGATGLEAGADCQPTGLTANYCNYGNSNVSYS